MPVTYPAPLQPLEPRYNHIVHLQTAAIGAEKFYTCEDHAARSWSCSTPPFPFFLLVIFLLVLLMTLLLRFEGLELARERDNNAMEAWRDHPYVDIIDNRFV